MSNGISSNLHPRRGERLSGLLLAEIVDLAKINLFRELSVPDRLRVYR